MSESDLNKYINALIVCKQTFRFAVALFFPKLKLIEGSKYSIVQMSRRHKFWPCACRALLFPLMKIFESKIAS